MNISLLQLILIGLAYYCGSSFWLNGWLSVNHPFMGATLAGIILKRPDLGAYYGAYIQLLYMSWLRMGGSGSVDSCFAGVAATAIGIAADLSIGPVVVLAYLLSLLTSKVWDIRNRYNLRLNVLADKADIDDIGKINAVYSQPYLLLITFVPACVVVYVGTRIFSSFAIPGIFSAYLDIFARMTPVIGIASVFKLSFKRRYIIYYVLGCLAAFVPSVPDVFVTLVCLAIICFISPKDLRKPEHLKERKNYLRRIARKDLDLSTVKMFLFQYQSVNYERYQALGLTHSLSHILKKLYEGDDLKDAKDRHVKENYGIEPYFGTILLGIIISMEEDRAIDGDVDKETITSAKLSLMGPISAIGDSINQFLSNHICLLIGIMLTLQNGLGAKGALVSFILINGIMLGQALCFTRFGYRYGLSAIASLNECNIMNVGIEIFTKLLIFIMGMVSVRFVRPSDIMPLNALAGIILSFACYHLFVRDRSVLHAFALIGIAAFFITALLLLLI